MIEYNATTTTAATTATTGTITRTTTITTTTTTTATTTTATRAIPNILNIHVHLDATNCFPIDQQHRSDSTKKMTKICITPLGDTLAMNTIDTVSFSSTTMQTQISPTISTLLHQRSRSTSISILRDKWANKVEFLLAVIGAFLIPYLIMLFIGGLPVFYMELVLGQFHRSVFGKRFVQCSKVLVMVYVSYVHLLLVSIMQLLRTPYTSYLNLYSLNGSNSTIAINESNQLNGKLRTPSEEFFLFNVLEENYSSGFNDLGGIKPSLALCLTIVFILVYFALWKGPRSSGKCVWVTATAPYIILSVLFVRGITLPGASVGIYYYLMPNFKMLLDIDVWTAAATQIFFSLGPGFGVLIALSSYNDFRNNCYRDALVTSFINCGTSFFSGFVIFATLGYMSTITNLPVNEVVGDNDANIIFIVYPQAIATMSYANCWSFVFFVMLITLGIDSTFSGIEALITGFCDEYPEVLIRRREIFVGFVIVVYYFGSLPTITYGGKYIISFLDEYGVSLSVLFIVMCEMIAVCWFYGIQQFSQDIQQMLGFYPGLYWRICWTCCPTIFLLTIYKTSLEPMTIGSYTYPQWSAYFGWFLRLTSILSIPFFAIYYFCIAKGTIKENQ
uniref:Uncharacterized protein n=1 Tax=Wuchereria bancrofti TaxID=6293 RepID=A0A1I8EKJ6_WUCBA